MDDMKKKLIGSCNQLKRDGILTMDDIKKCRKIDNSFSGLNKKLEKNVFNENREEERLSQLDNIHEYIEKIIEKEFDMLNKNVESKSNLTKDEFVELLNSPTYNFGQLYTLMRMIMIETDKKILKRYENNENINYDDLVSNYSKIDSNRIKMDEIGGSYETLMEVNEHEFEKLNKSSYTGYLIGVLLLFVIIVGLLVYIIKFMKI